MNVIVIIFCIISLTSLLQLSYLSKQEDKINSLKNSNTHLDNLSSRIEEDAFLLVPDIIRKYGYPCERHTVITPDGYILETHRIPHGKKGTLGKRPVVYLQHGILASSADWVLPGPDKGFDSGYDVWMPNVRGTRYSRRHIHLDPTKDSLKFWNFSWHEIGVIDVPVMIDYIIDKTKEQQIFYIGHSQGTTVFYVMCSEKPQYNDKIKAMFSLSPIAYMKHMVSPLLHILTQFRTETFAIYSLFDKFEFLPRNEFLAQIGDEFCNDNSSLQVLCTNALFAICGFNRKQMNTTLLPIIMGHTPAGASIKQICHYAQGVASGKFQQWDYGLLANIENYGNSSPPSYNLKKVYAPVYLFYSKNDWLANELDVKRLNSELFNSVSVKVYDDNFNHMDYLYAINADRLVYKKLLYIMKFYR